MSTLSIQRLNNKESVQKNDGLIVHLWGNENTWFLRPENVK